MRRDGPERTCLVTRAKAAPDRLLRFVVGPDGTVTPDVKARLPGRGAWTTPTRSAVAEAMRRKLFGRAFRREVVVPPDLADRIDRLLEAEALAALSLANKAGAVVAGFAKVEAAVADGRVAALVHAHDGGDDGVRKLGQALRRAGHDAAIARIGAFSSEQLGLALGRLNVIHAALLAGGPAALFIARCEALSRYRTGAPAGGPQADAPGEPTDTTVKGQPKGAGPTE